jgi:hypothetical protein
MNGHDGHNAAQEVAAAIDRLLVELVNFGALPADWRYSVHHSPGRSMQGLGLVALSPRPIYALDPRPSESWQQHPETGRYVRDRAQKLTVAAQKVGSLLAALVDREQSRGDLSYHWATTLGTLPCVPEYGGDLVPVVELASDADTLDAIAAHLTGREWESADLDDVAALVKATGRVIAGPHEAETDR